MWLSPKMTKQVSVRAMTESKPEPVIQSFPETDLWEDLVPSQETRHANELTGLQSPSVGIPKQAR